MTHDEARRLANQVLGRTGNVSLRSGQNVETTAEFADLSDRIRGMYPDTLASILTNALRRAPDDFMGSTPAGWRMTDRAFNAWQTANGQPLPCAGSGLRSLLSKKDYDGKPPSAG